MHWSCPFSQMQQNSMQFSLIFISTESINFVYIIKLNALLSPVWVFQRFPWFPRLRRENLKTISFPARKKLTRAIFVYFVPSSNVGAYLGEEFPQITSWQTGATSWPRKPQVCLCLVWFMDKGF